ncbi:hypothetical protein ACFVMC_27610 [Nocardia sp. NPDC127579]|uniref:hypothetical protein n=1 Tax=Nocardia sp. NPDC127579 TaxID=3345402 RepID=UPI00364262F7
MASIAWKTLIVGILILVFFMPRDHTPDLKVMCDNERMTPGTTCISTDSSKAGTYEERVQREIDNAESARRRDEKWGTELTILGGAITALSLAALIGGLVGMLRARQTVAPADQGWWSQNS